MQALRPPHLILPTAVLAIFIGGVAPRSEGAEFPFLQPGEPVRGMLEADGPALSNRGPFVAYRFVAGEGERWTLRLRSKDFDAYLTLGRMVGGIFDPLQYDDDSEGGTDARLRFRAAEPGEYVVLAQSIDGLQGAGVERGAFELLMEETPAPTTDQILALAIDSIIEGELAETDAIDDTDQSFYDLYRFEAKGGQRFEFVLRSEDFDAYLSYGDKRGDEFFEVRGNDDGGGGINGTDSRLRVLVDEPGVYHLRVRALGGDSAGRYTLEVRERQIDEESKPFPIVPGEEQLGVITEDSLHYDDEGLSDYYVYQAKAGERLVITLRSEEFDSFLAIGVLADGGFEELESNDDFEDESLDSQVQFRIPKDGEYLIRAASLDGDSEGSYQLLMRSSVES